MRLESHGDDYALILSSSELRTIVLSMLVLPDRWSDQAVRDLVGNTKQEISAIQVTRQRCKYALDREMVRAQMEREALLTGDSLDESILRARTPQELADEIAATAKTRAAAIEKSGIRDDILAEVLIFRLLEELRINGAVPKRKPLPGFSTRSHGTRPGHCSRMQPASVTANVSFPGQVTH